ADRERLARLDTGEDADQAVRYRIGPEDVPRQVLLGDPRGGHVAERPVRRRRDRFRVSLELVRYALGKSSEIFVQHAVARYEDVEAFHIRDRAQGPAKEQAVES